MNSRTMKFALCLLMMLIFGGQISYAQVRLPKLVSDGMILQRGLPVNIWGWASPEEKVSVSFNNKTYRTITGNDGKWQITLPSQKAGGPFTMDINASNKISLTDILVGDVWLCSGQSNMDFAMKGVADKYADIIAGSENSQIRQFKVMQKYDFNAPMEDYAGGKWIAADPKAVLDFSAVAYFFARELNAKYHVPVGIINASVGGSPAEAWMSAEALKAFPQFLTETEKFKDQAVIDEIQTRERKASNDWYLQVNKTDKGLQSQPRWKDPAFDASSWPSMPVPGYWADHGLGTMNGVVWFRREIDVPASMTGKPVRLYLGRIVDADSVFVNGKLAGTTSSQYPQRTYKVPAGVLQQGKNTIIMRIINFSGRGGFVPDKPYRLFADKDTIPLTGNWQYQPGCTMSPLPGQTPINWKPTGLYNGMIAPSNRYNIKGVVWYQGESNAGRSQEYLQLLPALIADWRFRHGQGDFPFLMAQLTNFLEVRDKPADSDWASFRNVQLKIAQSVVNTAMGVNIDLGEWNDVHPLNKQDVGKRLALAAEKMVYGEKKLVASGPTYQSMKVKGNKMELSFTDCGSGLMAKDGKELQQFAIAGADKKFVWAKAEIQGKKVLVWNDAIQNPVVVRYAWANNPEGANLYNKEGLPASPFTTEK